MKFVRRGYLTYVIVLALTHLFVTLSPWTTPALSGAISDEPIGMGWFIALFALWIVAAAADLILGLQGRLTLSFAGEAAVCLVALPVLMLLSPGVVYFLCAVAPPTLILVKAVEELAVIGRAAKAAQRSVPVQ